MSEWFNGWWRICGVALLRTRAALSLHRIWQGAAVLALTALYARIFFGSPQTLRAIITLVFMAVLAWVTVWVGTFVMELLIVIPELTQEQQERAKASIDPAEATTRLAEAIEEQNRIKEGKWLAKLSPLRAAMERARKSRR